MSTPFNPGQQPVPGNGQYPVGQQFAGGYAQQPGQQMPGAVGYGQSQGYGQQAQQGYFPQGQFQGAPYGAAPEKKKTGLIIGIIAAVLVVLIAAGVAIWWFMSDDDSSDDAAAQSAPSATAPSAGANPAQPPVGTNPSQPPVGTNPSQPPVGTNPSQPPVGTNPSQPPVGTNPSAPGGGSNSDLEQQAIAECTKEINSEYSNANVTGTNLELKDSYGNNKWWDYTGTLTGTDNITKKQVNTGFKCSVYYSASTKEYWAILIRAN